MSENDPKEIHNKETEIPKEVPIGKDGPYIIKPKPSEDNNLKNIQNRPDLEEDLDYLFFDLKNYSLMVNQIDTYANSIPVGSFCFAIAFILIGFLECKVYKVGEDDDIFYYIILLFGGLGQIIAGIFEYIKGRTFPSNLYLLFGIYFICYYYFNYYDIDDEKKKISLNDEVSSSFFYGSWAVLSFPIFFGSVQSNIFYLIQTLVVCAFFVVRCIGEYYGNDNMNEIISGVLELVTGFISLYICINQMINESFKFNAVPSLPLSKENEIDIIPDN